MANITEVTQYDPAIYQIAVTDAVQGGPGGVSNAQGQSLANRTNYLLTGLQQGARLNKVVPLSANTTLDLTYIGSLCQCTTAGNAYTLPLSSTMSTVTGLTTGMFVGFQYAASTYGKCTIQVQGTDTITDGLQAGLTSYFLYPGDTLLFLCMAGVWVVTMGRTNNYYSGIPIGTIIAMPVNITLPGWIKCNGAAISRNTYANLFAILGTSFGVGDGSTTFNLPDFRGVVLRGLDEGRGLDTNNPSRTIGSYEPDALAQHTHSFTSGESFTGGIGNSSPSITGHGADNPMTGITGGIYPGTYGSETVMKNVSVCFYIHY
jgi:microcystin-dependent protein